MLTCLSGLRLLGTHARSWREVKWSTQSRPSVRTTWTASQQFLSSLSVAVFSHETSVVGWTVDSPHGSDGDLPQLVCALIPTHHHFSLHSTRNKKSCPVLYGSRYRNGDTRIRTTYSAFIFLYRNYNITTRVVLAFTLFSSPLCVCEWAHHTQSRQRKRE